MSARITAVRGRAIVIPGDDIDTDRIVPARFLRCVTFDGLGEALFRDERVASSGAALDHPLDRAENSGASVLVSGRNFGCGSSREHAPQAIVRAGFQAVIAESFAEIFAANSLTLGLVCATVQPGDRLELLKALSTSPAAAVEIDLSAMQVRCGELTIPFSLPDSARAALLEGRWDPLTELLEGADSVRELRRNVPYLAWCST